MLGRPVSRQEPSEGPASCSSLEKPFCERGAAKSSKKRGKNTKSEKQQEQVENREQGTNKGDVVKRPKAFSPRVVALRPLDVVLCKGERIAQFL